MQQTLGSLPVSNYMYDSNAKDDTKSKMSLIFTSDVYDCLDLFSTLMALKTFSGKICNNSVQFQMEIREISCQLSCSSDYAEFCHFMFFFAENGKEFAKIYNACAPLLFCPLNLLLVTFLLLSLIAVFDVLRKQSNTLQHNFF